MNPLGRSAPARCARLPLLVSAASLALCASANAPASEAPTPAEIVMVGIVPKARGHLRCGVFDRGGWLRRPLQSAAVVPEGLRAVCRFASLTPGSYALGAFLDENDNGNLDRDLLGYPQEPYGVSNGARVQFLLPPSFDAAKVEYRGGELMLELRIE